MQFTSSDDGLSKIVSQVLDLRARRLAAQDRRQFDQEVREAAADAYQYATQTFNDYADANSRYLKATGLLQSKCNSSGDE